jgi:acetyl-CoA carboxylase biotin carboxyl carrier protein
MNIDEVYKLVDYFEKSSLSKMGLEMEGVKLSLERGGETTYTAPLSQNGRQTSQMSLKEEVKETEHVKESIGESTPAEGEILIKAPLVGTFYRSASPEEKPFVMIGETVKKGDVVGIIEAMKLMNEITAPSDGVIEAIEADNEAMVEYNQVLIRMKES